MFREMEEEEARARTLEWAKQRAKGEAIVRAAVREVDSRQAAPEKGPSLSSAPCTPEKNGRERGQAAVVSPLSKASTPERSTAAPRYLDGEAGVVIGKIDFSCATQIEKQDQSPTTDDISPGSWSQNRKKLRLAARSKSERFFGQYDEDDPEPFLLMQDLVSWHKRGVDRVSVTVLSDDKPFDPSPLLMQGSADLDMDTLEDTKVEYDEENPDPWLLAQDVKALSRRGAERVTITVLPDEESTDESGQATLAHRHDHESEVEIDTDVLGPTPYSEEHPEMWLLQQDLIALHRRGAGMVSVTVLTDDEPADVTDLVWPMGSGHIDLRSHYRDAVAYPEPEEGREEEAAADAALEDFLLLQDLMAVQDAGADAVSVTCISHDAPEDTSRLQGAGWEISHPLAAPTPVLLLA